MFHRTVSFIYSGSGQSDVPDLLHQFYSIQSPKMSHPPKPIRNPRKVADDILDELHQIHPFKKNPSLIRKIRKYVFSKKFIEDSHQNYHIPGLYLWKDENVNNTTKQGTKNSDDAKLKDVRLKFVARGSNESSYVNKLSSQECCVFGEQAIINSVGYQLKEQKNIRQETKFLKISKPLRKPSSNLDYEDQYIPGVEGKQKCLETRPSNISNLHRSGFDGSWSMEDGRSQNPNERCCPRRNSLSWKDKEHMQQVISSNLKSQTPLRFQGTPDNHSYPICPRGTAAIFLKTYSTYNIKWQFRSKYVTLGVQKKRKRKTKWSARQWAWFMKSRGKKADKKHRRKMLRRKKRKESLLEDAEPLAQGNDADQTRRRRSSKVISRFQRLKLKVNC